MSALNPERKKTTYRVAMRRLMVLDGLGMAIAPVMRLFLLQRFLVKRLRLLTRTRSPAIVYPPFYQRVTIALWQMDDRLTMIPTENAKPRAPSCALLGPAAGRSCSVERGATGRLARRSTLADGQDAKDVQPPSILEECLLLAHRVISLPCSNSVAF